MGSKWQNCEAEHAAVQTLTACALNFAKTGEAISWVGKNALRGRQQCGTDNRAGIGKLEADGMVEMAEYNGDLQPPKPADIARENGNFLVLRVTNKLVDYANGMEGSP